MLASHAMRLVAPARHAAAAGRVLVGSKLQQGPAQLRGVHPWNTRAEATDTAQTEYAGPPPLFTAFNIYKGKGAVAVKPMKPKWSTMESGAFRLDKEGGFMFEVAPSIGTRQYDWPNKINVLLNPLELSEIVTDPDKENGHNFYHDTFKGQSGREGLMVKQFKWTKDPSNTAYYINVYSTDKQGGTEKKTSATCSLTHAEFGILKQLVLSSMHAFYGFDAALSNSPFP